MTGPTKAEDAIALVKQIDSDAAKTLESLLDSRNGNFTGAQNALATEKAPNTRLPEVDQVISYSTGKAADANSRGDKQTAVQSSETAFDFQFAAAALTKMNSGQSEKVLSSLRAFAGDKAVEELKALNMTSWAVLADKNANKDMTYDLKQQQIHATALAKELHKAIDGIKGGETHTGKPTASTFYLPPKNGNDRGLT